MSRITTSQVHALSQLFADIEVGMESLCGVDTRSLRCLEGRGYVRARGVRKTYWTLTPEGKEAIMWLTAQKRLIAEGKYA